ncbi:FixH family protein [Microvirga arabica]|uniref:FixH family protein n=1 Tax=Microvirga arabica TaxID=1128671 RepID=UPI00193A8D1A|nr:FixH family protein [Microvirga arabica]MBM1170129.1 FixH family protein [Microvirga arabica]
MKKAVITLLFLVALGAATATGYRVGKGGLTLPAWVPPQVTTALAGLLPAPAASSISTEALNDYEFRLVSPQARSGEALVAVELIHKPTDKPVPDAVIFARRLDMAPEDMAMMTAPLEPQPADKPGTYLFKTNLAMEGGWQVSLAAKVPGEAGTVQGKLILKAVQ